MLFVASILLLISNVKCSDRDFTVPLGGNGLVIDIQSASNFCMFLPPNINQTIADSEGYPHPTPEVGATFAVSFCTQPNANAKGARLFYDGFITGAHYKKTSTYVQITGTINADAAGIPKDGGGFYDLDNNVNSPPGGMCAGYDSFYNAVNPIDGIFCIKCCVGITTCQIYLHAGGCAVIAPGVYDKTFDEPLPKTGVNINPALNKTSTGDGGSTSTPKDPSKASSTKSNDWKIMPSNLLILFLIIAVLR